MRAPTAIAVAGRVARAVSEPAPPHERALAALDALRALVPYVGAEVSSWDPVARVHRTLANDDYPADVVRHFNGDQFALELAQLRMPESGSPVRMRDVPDGALARDGSIRDVLLPAGYREGVTMCLRTADGRPTGVVNLSVDVATHPTDDACTALRSLNHALANVADVTQSCRWLCRLLGSDVAAVALTDGGDPVPLPGVATLDVLDPSSSAIDAAHALFGRPGHLRRFLARDAARRWWRIGVVPCREPGMPAVVAVVTAEPAEVHELTRRELEVLTLLADGLSNGEIARRLVVSARTVSTHVERILEKLGVPTRAAAASVAVREGLLLAS